jgi:hypothetical protein
MTQHSPLPPSGGEGRVRGTSLSIQLGPIGFRNPVVTASASLGEAIPSRPGGGGQGEGGSSS